LGRNELYRTCLTVNAVIIRQRIIIDYVWVVGGLFVYVWIFGGGGCGMLEVCVCENTPSRHRNNCLCASIQTDTERTKSQHILGLCVE